MTRNLHEELCAGLCHADPERIAFTRKAFHLLPVMQAPDILDVGCGKGDPTLELARLTDGGIVGIDIDQTALGQLERRAGELGLAERVRTLNHSLRDMRFPDGSFDLIWAEAAAHIIGFERALDDWRRLLRPAGFLVIHDMTWLRPAPPAPLASHWQRIFPGIRTVPEYMAEIPRHGYTTREHFALPDGFWWHRYFRPLERRIATLREKYDQEPRLLAQLERQQHEIDLHRQHPGWFGSASFIMQRDDPVAGAPRAPWPPPASGPRGS